MAAGAGPCWLRSPLQPLLLLLCLACSVAVELTCLTFIEFILSRWYILMAACTPLRPHTQCTTLLIVPSPSIF